MKISNIQNYTTIKDSIVEQIVNELPFNSITLNEVNYQRCGYGQYNLYALFEFDGEIKKLSAHSTDSMLIDNWNEDYKNFVGFQKEDSIIVALRTIVRENKDVI